MLAPHPPHQMACSLNNSSISNSIDIVAILIPAEKTKSDILIETFMSRPKNDMFYYLISFFIEMKLKLKVGKFFIALTLGFLKVACYCYPTWNAFRFSWKILLSTGKDPTHFRKIYFSHWNGTQVESESIFTVLMLGCIGFLKVTCYCYPI